MKIVAKVGKMVQNYFNYAFLDYLCSLFHIQLFSEHSSQSTCKIFIPMNLLYRFRSSRFTWNHPVFKSSVNPNQKPAHPDPDCFPLINANE